MSRPGQGASARSFDQITAQIVALFAALCLAGCSRQIDVAAPPRNTDPPKLVIQSSSLQAPIYFSLDELQAALSAAVPRQLWSIDQQHEDCVPSKHVRVLGRSLAVTPKLGCRIVGNVVRGALRLEGKGRELRIRMPVSATISARDVGGILKGETADGSADVEMTVKVTMRRDWSLDADVQLSYDWREPPGIEFLGQRISLANRADRELAGVIARLEQEIERKLNQAPLRPKLEEIWQKGFTSVSVNRQNPPVWIRITPQELGLEGYAVEGRQLVIRAAVRALTETFVQADAPAPAKPTPLPPMATDIDTGGLRLTVPILADYSQLEPVVLRALTKLAAKGITLEGIGAVDARFDKVTIYATDANRLAVGVEARVKPLEKLTSMGTTKGVIWLTGAPFNEPNSQVISVRDLSIYGGTDGVATNLLTAMLDDAKVRASIQGALVEDFGKDYAKLMADVRRAVAELHTGDLSVAMSLDNVEHGRVIATGKGLFLPVTGRGTARISVDID